MYPRQASALAGNQVPGRYRTAQPHPGYGPRRQAGLVCLAGGPFLAGRRVRPGQGQFTSAHAGRDRVSPKEACEGRVSWRIRFVLLANQSLFYPTESTCPVSNRMGVLPLPAIRRPP